MLYLSFLDICIFILLFIYFNVSSLYFHVYVIKLFSFVDMSVICADQTLVSDISAVTCRASVLRILSEHHYCPIYKYQIPIPKYQKTKIQKYQNTKIPNANVSSSIYISVVTSGASVSRILSNAIAQYSPRTIIFIIIIITNIFIIIIIIVVLAYQKYLATPLPNIRR